MKKHTQVNVLIAESNPDVVAVIKDTLDQIGYTVAGEASDGQEAIEKVQLLEPDVVLMDIKLKTMNGVEATRRIHEQCPTPVVILTAYDGLELVKQASEAGAGAYLLTPPSARELERAIIIAIARFEDMVELRRLNAELKMRNQELDAFAYTVAHQLKNSASLVATFGNILDTQLELTGEDQEILDGIIQSGRKMNSIISELQLLAGIRTGNIEQQPLDMLQIVAEAQQRLNHLIEERQAQIDLPDEWPLAVGYAPWIEEVWVNYIGNAVKYGGNPPKIKIGAQPQANDMVYFWVWDNGPGISSEEQSELFEPFTRYDQVQIEGHGLGLSIVRQIVEKLGGSVGVESKGDLEQGSRFWFTLPAAR